MREPPRIVDVPPVAQATSAELHATPPLDGEGTTVLGKVSEFSPLVVTREHLYVSEEGSDRDEVFFRVDLATRKNRQNILSAHMFLAQLAGDGVLVQAGHPDRRTSALQSEWTTHFVDASGIAHPFGPSSASTWDRDHARVVIARPPTGEGTVVIESFAPDAPDRPERVATIRSSAFDGGAELIAASSRGVFVSFRDANQTNVSLFSSTILQIPKPGAPPVRVDSEDAVLDFLLTKDAFFIGCLANVYRYDFDPSRPVHRIDNIYWDALAFDGEVAYFHYQTGRVEGGIGGRLFAWHPDGEVIEVKDDLNRPMAIGLDAERVYWIDGRAREVRHAPRVPGY